VEILDELVTEEKRRLQALAENGSMVARFRQRRRLGRARRVAAWSRSRRRGKDAFIRDHGVVRHGLTAALTTAAGLFFAVGSDRLADGVSLIIISLTVGLFIGVLMGISEWERSEAELSATLSRLSAGQDGPTTHEGASANWG
jgi:hypothetical protein